VTAFLVAAALITCGPIRVGTFSFYGAEGCGVAPPNCRTADGTPYNPNGLTAAASERWMMGQYATVSNQANGRSQRVYVNDYCPGCARLGRVLDLSQGAYRALGGVGLFRGSAAFGECPASPIPAPPSPPTEETVVMYWDHDAWVTKRVWRRVDGSTIDTFEVRPN
jgi:hypothetical protein